MIPAGQRVTHKGRPAVTVDPLNRDTWPTYQGKYHPGSPFGDSHLWTLVRWLDWADDQWIPTRQLERTAEDDAIAGVRAVVHERTSEGARGELQSVWTRRRRGLHKPGHRAGV